MGRHLIYPIRDWHNGKQRIGLCAPTWQYITQAEEKRLVAVLRERIAGIEREFSSVVRVRGMWVVWRIS